MLLLVIFCITHSATEAILQVTDREYPMMDGIKHISDELFPTGQPLVIVLPLVEDESTKSEVDYLIKELHSSSRWSTIVMNVTYERNTNVRIEINQPGSYNILISGNCQESTSYINNIRKQLFGLSEGSMWQSWNAKAWFVVAVMTPCKHYDNTIISKFILSVLWTVKVTNFVVVFKQTSGHVSNFHQQKTSDSEPQVLFSLHTWFPYENSQSCNPFAGNVTLHTFLIRNVSDIVYSRMVRKVPVKNFHGCRFGLFAFQRAPFVQPPQRIFNIDSRKYKDIYQAGLDIEMLAMISKSLNISFVAQREPLVWDTNEENSKQMEFIIREAIKSKADIMIGGFDRLNEVDEFFSNSHSYIYIRTYWITPSAIKYHSWTRILKTFSGDIWTVFTLLLVFAVISVNFISFYGPKRHLSESRTYQNVPSTTSNVIAIALGVSVVTQPRTAPLRVFFVCWVWYSVAISTVFQAFFTTFIIEPGYEEPIKNTDQLFNSGTKIFVPFAYKEYLSIGSEKCPGDITCLIWAMLYQNISTITYDFVRDSFKGFGFSTDKYNRPTISELEDGNVNYVGIVILVSKGHYLLEYINKVIDHTVEAGLPMYWLQFVFNRKQIYANATYTHTFADSYVDMNVTHFQPVFYVLLLGYILSLLCFVFEIVWYCLISKRRHITHLHAST